MQRREHLPGALMPRCSVHVKNIPPTATYQDLWAEFAKIGDVVNVTIPVDVNTAKGKGYAFIEFSDPGDAAKAISTMDGVQLWGRILAVEYSRSYPKSSREMAIRSALGTLKSTLGPPIIPLLPLVARPIPLSRSRHSSSSGSYYRYRSRRKRSYTRSSRSSGSRSSCSCCRYSRSRSTSFSRHSRSQTTSPSDVSRACSSESRSRRTRSSRSEGEVTDFEENDYVLAENVPDELPDSLVIAANLLPSPTSSVSLYAASSGSSRDTSPEITRPERSRTKWKSSTSCSD